MFNTTKIPLIHEIPLPPVVLPAGTMFRNHVVAECRGLMPSRHIEARLSGEDPVSGKHWDTGWYPIGMIHAGIAAWKGGCTGINAFSFMSAHERACFVVDNSTIDNL